MGVLAEQCDLIAHYGCRCGTLCSELAKRADGSDPLVDPRRPARRVEKGLTGSQRQRTAVPVDDSERRAYPIVPDLAAFAELVPVDHGLCVINTLRGDGSVQSSVVNAGVLQHPLREDQVVGLVAISGTRKLHNLRAETRVTIVVRAGWRWATVEGDAEIIGPDDQHPDVDSDALRLLLRDIFRAADGIHDDWDTYDRVMADERRAAVLIAPRRVYTNPQT